MPGAAPRPSALAVAGLLAGTYGAGLGLGVALWGAIRLPFENSWRIVSPLSVAGVNAADDLVRFACLAALPTALLGLLYLLGGRGWARACFAPSSSAGPGEPSGAVTRRRWAASAVLLGALAAAAALHVRTDAADGPLDTFHEGESLGPAALYERGMMPYRDVFIAHGPFQNPLRSVVAFGLFGRAVSSARAVQSALKVLEFVLIALFIGQVFRGRFLPWVATLALYLLPFFAENEMGPWVFATQRDVTVFAFLIAAVWAHRRLGRAPLTPLGALAAGFWPFFLAFGALIYSVDRGIFLSVACLVLSGASWWTCRPGRRHSAAYAAGAALGVGAAGVLLATLLGGSLTPFLHDVFGVVPRYWDQLVGLEYPILSGPFLLAAAVVAANLYWMCLTFLRLLRASGGRWADAARRLAEGYFCELALLVCSTLLFKSALGRSDWGHVAIALGPAYLLLLLLAVRQGAARLVVGRRTRACAACFLVVGAAWCGWLAVRAADAEVLERNFPIGVRDEQFVPQSYLDTAEFLEKNLAEGETFYTLTSEGIWYYLVDKPSPTRFPILYYAATDFFQREVVADLQRNPVKFIIVSNDSWYNNMDGFSVAERVPIVVEYVVRNYAPFARIGDNILWARRPG